VNREEVSDKGIASNRRVKMMSSVRRKKGATISVSKELKK